MDYLSIYDQSVLFGFGLFETVYVKDKGDVFLLSWHIRRMCNSARYFDFEWTYSEEETKSFVRDFIDENCLKNLVLRITLNAGNRTKGIKPSLTYTTRSYDYSNEVISKGAKLCISDIRKSKSSIMLKHKTSNYLENLMVLQKAKRQNYDDAVFLNEQGFVTETTKSNIFGVIDNNIFTPKLQCGLLPGIIREWVITNAFQFGCVCVEEEMTEDRLKSFEEVFITNSIFGVMHVTQIGEEKKYNETPGKISFAMRGKILESIL